MLTSSGPGSEGGSLPASVSELDLWAGDGLVSRQGKGQARTLSRTYSDLGPLRVHEVDDPLGRCDVRV